MPAPASAAARIADLRGRLQARQGRLGYRKNVQALKAEIARLQQQEAGHGQATG